MNAVNTRKENMVQQNKLWEIKKLLKNFQD